MMTKSKGIDVSYHNGIIEWETVRKYVNFAMIRAGYGRGNIDEKFYRNSVECERNNIPYGYYWFSYAYTPEMAIMEADYCCDLITPFSPTYPIAFDFEYGSIEYAKRHGYNLTAEDVVAICTAFLNRVEERGYYAMLYSNIDFLERYNLKSLTDRYALWIAKWSNTPPSSYKYGIWQYGIGEIEGVGKVDMNVCVKDYDKIISSLYKFANDKKISIALSMGESWWNKYVLLAKRILVGIYSDLEAQEICVHNGMDYDIVEKIMDVIYE